MQLTRVKQRLTRRAGAAGRAPLPAEPRLEPAPEAKTGSTVSSDSISSTGSSRRQLAGSSASLSESWAETFVQVLHQRCNTETGAREHAFRPAASCQLIPGHKSIPSPPTTQPTQVGQPKRWGVDFRRWRANARKRAGSDCIMHRLSTRRARGRSQQSTRARPRHGGRTVSLEPRPRANEAVSDKLRRSASAMLSAALS